jgi:hypothetical protein
VKAGSALVPSGRLVCVPADQCAFLNRWLAKPENAAVVNRILNPTSPPLSPPVFPPPDVGSGRIPLYLTLCYTECLTRPVPIPGEPCRSEDQLMADSRVAEDFRLELRESPPAQLEEEAVREFVAWLHSSVAVVAASSSPAGDEPSWLDALRSGAQSWLEPSSPSPPPPGGDMVSPLPALAPPVEVEADRLCDFLRVAFRFWVTELRPVWMAKRCHRVVERDVDCVLLARIELDVEWIGGSPRGAFQVVGDSSSVSVDEAKRPFVAHLRMLQEWGLCGCCGGGLGAAPAVATPPLGPSIVLPALRAGAPPVPRVPVRVTTGDLLLDESHYLVVGSGGAPVRLTLPRSTPAGAGRVYVVKNAGASTMTLSAAAGDSIDQARSVRVNRNVARTVVADGAGRWHVIAGEDRP